MVVRRRKRPALVPEHLSEDEVRTLMDWIQDFEKHESAKRPQPKSASNGNPPEPKRRLMIKTGESSR